MFVCSHLRKQLMSVGSHLRKQLMFARSHLRKQPSLPQPAIYVKSLVALGRLCKHYVNV